MCNSLPSLGKDEQSSADYVESGHRGQRPEERDGVQRFPVVFSGDLEHRRISPEQERRLTLYRVDIRPASVDDLIRHDGIDRFIIDGLWVEKRWQSGRDREQNDRNRDELELSKATG
jgi:hypothetical protein